MSPDALAAAADIVTRVSVVAYLRIRDGGPVPLAELAERFRIPARSMRTLIEQVASSGTDEADPSTFFDIDWDELDRGSVLVTRFVAFEEPPVLGSAERAALIAGLRLLASLEDARDRAEIDALIAKLGGGARIAAVPDSALSADGELLARAIEDRRQVRFRYRSDSSGDRVRTADPVLLYGLDDIVYLYGWCRDADDGRRFAVDKMRDLEVLAAAAAAHEAFADAPLFSASDDHAAVTLRVAPSALPQAVEFLPDGERRPDAAKPGPHELVVRIANLRRLARLVAEHAGRIQVAGPAEARQASAAWARQALDLYAAEGSRE